MAPSGGVNMAIHRFLQSIQGNFHTQDRAPIADEIRRKQPAIDEHLDGLRQSGEVEMADYYGEVLERFQDARTLLINADTTPATDQNIPERLRRAPMTDLQPASTTPEPTKRPSARNLG